MIISNKEAANRLDSPLNLINRLKNVTNLSKRNDAMQLFTGPRQGSQQFNPFEKPQTPPVEVPEKEEPSLDTILENSESQIKLGLSHDRSLDLLVRSVDLLATKLDDVKADRLPSVITAASKVVESIRRERSEASKNNKDREVHYHFYTPEQKKVSDFEVIEVQ